MPCCKITLHLECLSVYRFRRDSSGLPAYRNCMVCKEYIPAPFIFREAFRRQKDYTLQEAYIRNCGESLIDTHLIEHKKAFPDYFCNYRDPDMSIGGHLHEIRASLATFCLTEMREEINAYGEDAFIENNESVRRSFYKDLAEMRVSRPKRFKSMFALDLYDSAIEDLAAINQYNRSTSSSPVPDDSSTGEMDSDNEDLFVCYSSPLPSLATNHGTVDSDGETADRDEEDFPDLINGPLPADRDEEDFPDLTDGPLPADRDEEDFPDLINGPLPADRDEEDFPDLINGPLPPVPAFSSESSRPPLPSSTTHNISEDEDQDSDFDLPDILPTPVSTEPRRRKKKNSKERKIANIDKMLDRQENVMKSFWARRVRISTTCAHSLSRLLNDQREAVRKTQKYLSRRHVHVSHNPRAGRFRNRITKSNACILQLERDIKQVYIHLQKMKRKINS
uniref:Wsv079-like protein n=1 Tax=Trachysalambria curvirostris nimavirus TaxID=2984282 RepID=A0A9C7BN03_9VIRU|nr:MAG: wsv079-like protein [Trachysalambria curvirostris nimavirus]